jgi:Flp pilus assembly pilin Flp
MRGTNLRDEYDSRAFRIWDRGTFCGLPGNQKLTLRYSEIGNLYHSEAAMPERFPKKSCERGETMVEYVLMLALIFLIVVLASVTVGERASSVFNRASDILLHFAR